MSSCPDEKKKEFFGDFLGKIYILTEAGGGKDENEGKNCCK